MSDDPDGDHRREDDKLVEKWAPEGGLRGRMEPEKYCRECGRRLDLADIHAGIDICFWCDNPPWGPTEG